MNEEANSAKELAEQLLYKVPHVLDAEPVVKDAAWAFCEEYRGFMNRAKTEREFVTQAVALLQQAGYQVYQPGTRYAPGQRVYWVNRQKALLATTFGSRPLSEGVRINAVCPGMIRTPMTQAGPMKAVIDDMVVTTPIGRLGEPEEIGAAVLWLCGDDATFVHGQAIPIDGAITSR